MEKDPSVDASSEPADTSEPNKAPRVGRMRLREQRSRQALLLEAVTAGASIAQAAVAAGVTEATAERWMCDLEFRARRVSVQREQLDVFVARVVRFAGDAMISLRRLAENGASEIVRLRAAQIIVDKAERLLLEHPDYRPKSAGGAPMFALPPGTNVMAMLVTRAPEPAQQRSSLEVGALDVTAVDVTPTDHPVSHEPGVYDRPRETHSTGEPGDETQEPALEPLAYPPEPEPEPAELDFDDAPASEAELASAQANEQARLAAQQHPPATVTPIRPRKRP